MVMSGWRKARNALGLHVCVSPQLDNPEEPTSFISKVSAPTTPPSSSATSNTSSMNMIEAAAEVNRALENLTNLTAATSCSSATLAGANGHSTAAAALLSPRFSSKLHLMRNALRSSRSTCAICLEAMKAGNGHALFTAECSHSFHFACIASNVRHGNLVCPVCRATWKDVPWQAPSLGSKEKGGGRSDGSGSGGRNHDHHHHHHHHHHHRQQQHHLHHEGMRRSSSVSPARRPELRSPDFLREALRDAEEEQRRLEPVLRMLDESIANFRSAEERQKLLAEAEPATYDDDEALDGGPAEDGFRQDDGVWQDAAGEGKGSSSSMGAAMQAVQITTVAEESEVICWQERDSLTVLVHVNAAAGKEEEEELARSMLGSSAGILSPAGRRAAVDLVAVLDVSGSMAGVKLSLLKRAMAMVVRSLGPADRLSIVAFASRARRVMPLRRMSDDGRRAALQAVDGLACTGGTNISDGLRRGTDVLQQRRQRNPVATIMLLSDGQDTYTMRAASPPPAAAAASPSRHFQIPVHTFGLGVDHDAGTMHSISEESGGTFSFVQGEGLVQDAFAQCLGGLLSVVALRVEVEVLTADPSAAQLVRVESGSYLCSTVTPGRQAVVHLGDLYAHEERDLLVELRLPALSAPPAAASAEVLYVRASYKDPVSGAVRQTPVTAVAVQRPAEAAATVVGGVPATPCVEVDRHRNRLHAARAIVEARSLADAGDLAAAQRGLEAARQRLQGSAALASGDKLSAALDAELARIQASMSSRHAYRTCGRAYALSAQGSHMRQRATMRSGGGDDGDGYRTPSMNSMLQRSRALVEAQPPEAAVAPSPSHQVARRLLQPPSSVAHSRRRHILEPRPGSRLARLASFDSVIRP